MSRFRLACLLGFTLALAGCGRGDGGKASVTGKLTVKGAVPANGTLVKFISADGKESSSVVDADGNYSVGELSPGEAKIIVTGSDPVSAPGAKTLTGMSGGPKGNPVPKKFAKPGAVPNLTLDKGSNTHDIDLQP